MIGAIDRIITLDRLRAYAGGFLCAGLLTLIATIVFGNWPHVMGGGIVAPDYLAHWTGGRMLLNGQTSQLYDPTAQLVTQRHEVGAGGQLSWFISPPFAAALYAPLALLGYGSSVTVWTLISMSCLVGSWRLARPLAPRLFAEHPVLVVVMLAAFEPVLELVGAGQDSAVSLLLWLAGTRLMLAGRDVPAGVVFALGLFKPQQFLLVPVVLLVQRRYKALTAWGVTAGALGLASVAIVGVHGVVDWLRLPSSAYYLLTVHVDQAWKMQSLPALITTFLPTSASDAASLMAAAITLVAVVILVHQLVRGRSVVEQWMLAMLVTVVASPHLFIYDVVLVLPPLLYLVEHRPTRAVRLGCLALFILTWTVPFRHVIAGGWPWPASWVEASWAAIPLVLLWREFSRYDRDARVPHLGGVG